MSHANPSKRKHAMKKNALMSIAAMVAGLALAQERNVVLVVQNHTDASSIVSTEIADTLTASLAGRGFNLINPDNSFGVGQNRTKFGERIPNISAIELARELRADGAMTAAVQEYVVEPIGVPARGCVVKVRFAINLFDAATEAAVCGVSTVFRSQQYTVARFNANERSITEEALHAAAESCADLFVQKMSGIDWRPQSQSASGAGVVQAERVRSYGPLTMADLDAAYGAMLEGMVVSPLFVKNYGEKQSAMDKMPIAIVGEIKDATGLGLADMLAATRDNIRVRLFKTKLFDVKDDAASVELGNRIIAGGNSVLEDGELFQALKQHGSPDFMVLGDIRLFADFAGRKTFRLHLALHDFATGRIVWEDIDTIVKGR